MISISLRLCNEIIFPVALAHSSDYHCWRAFSPEVAPRTPGRAASDSGIGVRRHRGEGPRVRAGDGRARRVFEELASRLQSDPGRAAGDQRPCSSHKRVAAARPVTSVAAARAVDGVAAVESALNLPLRSSR